MPVQNVRQELAVGGVGTCGSWGAGGTRGSRDACAAANGRNGARGGTPRGSQRPGCGASGRQAAGHVAGVEQRPERYPHVPKAEHGCHITACTTRSKHAFGHPLQHPNKHTTTALDSASPSAPGRPDGESSLSHGPGRACRHPSTPPKRQGQKRRLLPRGGQTTPATPEHRP